ncbi:DUF6174 domain-containing protein [Streptomyces mayteni]
MTDSVGKRRAGWAGVLAVLVTGCGGGGGGGAAVPEWEEPAAYRYVLESTCGETLTGTFEIAVAEGEVAEVTDPGGFYDPGDLSPEMGMTIGQLRELVAEAEDEGADRLDVEYAADDEGRPTRIAVDYDEVALDDELCYAVRDYAPGS